MIRKIYPDFAGGRQGLGLLLVRMVVGLAFMFHGWPKITHIAGLADMLHVPLFLAGAAAVSEFVGGAMLVLGLGMPLWNLLLCTTMAVAYFKVHIGQPFVAAAGGPNWELAGVYFFANAALLCLGPGKFSIDALIFGRTKAA